MKSVKFRTMWNGIFMLLIMMGTMFALTSCDPDEEDIDRIENNTGSSQSGNSSGTGSSGNGTSSTKEFRLTKCTLTPGSTHIAVQAYFSKEPSSVKIYYQATGSAYELSTSATNISGTKAISTLTALKRNTKYYVRFVAKDKNMKTCESSKFSTITTN